MIGRENTGFGLSFHLVPARARKISPACCRYALRREFATMLSDFLFEFRDGKIVDQLCRSKSCRASKC
jgi:hypothetical protein